MLRKHVETNRQPWWNQQGSVIFYFYKQDTLAPKWKSTRSSLGATAFGVLVPRQPRGDVVSQDFNTLSDTESDPCEKCFQISTCALPQ